MKKSATSAKRGWKFIPTGILRNKSVNNSTIRMVLTNHQDDDASSAGSENLFITPIKLFCE